MRSTKSSPKTDGESLVYFPVPDGRPAAASGNIVIVDDSVANLKIYTRLATLLGTNVTVHPFTNPRLALDWLGQNAADLVISDYKMPIMDGAAFTRCIRKLPLCADVPVVIVTAYADRSFRLNALESGATDFLISPVDYLEFQTRSRNLMRLGHHQRLMRAHATRLASKLQETEHSRDRILRESRERLAQVIDTVPAMINATDTEGECIFVNAYQMAALGGIGRRKADARYDEAASRHVLASGRTLDAYEEPIVDLAGRERIFLTMKSPLKDSAGNMEGVLTTSLDITERKHIEAQILYLAQHDHLTSLANRTELYARLQQEFESRRETRDMFALHFIDLDRFKYINDGLGHSFGNRLLQDVARRLLAMVGPDDTVARIGGDEFAILQTRADGENDAERLAERINRALLEPFVIGDHRIVAGASIGIALYPRDGGSPEDLMQNADLTMYRVKSTQRNGFGLFTGDMKEEIQHKLRLQNDLRLALDNNELVMFYQPLFDIRSGRVVGAEALVRWRDPRGTLMAPDHFLPLAKETGLIQEIDQWVLREACRQANAWRVTCPHPLRVSVNLSPQHTSSVNIFDMVMAELAGSGLPPARLAIELTEDILIDGSNPAIGDLSDLRRCGVRIAIDDFGTGHSSLARLSTLPVDQIKIDRSFVTGLAAHSNRAVLAAIVSLGRALDLDVLAEGVETEEQLERVKLAGCDAVQGYYPCGPVEAAQFEEFVRSHEAGDGNWKKAGPLADTGADRP